MDRKFKPLVISPPVLGHIHISQGPSIGDGSKVFEAVEEGDWAWRLGGGVAVPAAELGDDPGGPGQRSLGVGIGLQLGLALETAFEGGEGVDLGCSEGQACRLVIAAAAGLDELEDDCCG